LSRYGLEIRAAVASDAAGLAQLLEPLHPSIPYRQLAERIEQQRASAGTVLLALEWGPPTGLVALHWYRTLFSDQPVARVTALFVDPDQRRRGIGRLLVKAASQAARVAGCATLLLDADPAASTLDPFCHATGFTAHGTTFDRHLRKGGA
jgi:aminoglycoside 6'-N-acetyltransferase I